MGGTALFMKQGHFKTKRGGGGRVVERMPLLEDLVYLTKKNQVIVFVEPSPRAAFSALAGSFALMEFSALSCWLLSFPTLALRAVHGSFWWFFGMGSQQLCLAFLALKTV